MTAFGWEWKAQERPTLGCLIAGRLSSERMESCGENCRSTRDRRAAYVGWTAVTAEIRALMAALPRFWKIAAVLKAFRVSDNWRCVDALQLLNFSRMLG